MPILNVQTVSLHTHKPSDCQSRTISSRPPSPSNSIDTDVEYFPSNFEPASVDQVNRFTELTGVTPRQAKKYLHQYRHVLTGDILFDDAVRTYLDNHDHEDDEEYIYGEEGCFCLDNAAELVLCEVIRDVREGLGREQRDEETLWYEIREMVLAIARVGGMRHKKLDVPLTVIKRVKEMIDLALGGMGRQTPSLHEELFRRDSKVQGLRDPRSRKTGVKKPRN